MTAEEALAYWRRKVPVTKQDFDALTQEMQALAFTASGVHRLEDLQAVSDAIGRAIANGTTLDQFRSEVGDLLKNRRHHIETVFRTNTQTAYNVGRYKRQMETAGDLPYWRYSAVNDSRTRPTHRAMHGRVWPASHPVWDTWYPPNGYRCRCSVIAMTARQVERMGLKVETIDPTHELIEPIAPNGERMPGRPLIPDQGFGYNPAKEVWKPDLSGIRADLRENLLRELARGLCGAEFAASADDLICPLLKKWLSQEDIEALTALIEADQIKQRMTFEEWARQAMRNKGMRQPKQEIWPIGSLPSNVLMAIPRQPITSLVMLTDVGVMHLFDVDKVRRGAAIKFTELVELPDKWKDAVWYIDKFDEAALATFVRIDNKKIIKFVIKFDRKVGKGRANLIVTAGVVEGYNLIAERYQKI